MAMNRENTYDVPTRVHVYEDDYPRLRAWLRENIGPPYETWITYSMADDGIGVTVDSEESAVLITLVWA